MAALASLPRGEAYFWSPGWLDVFQRVCVRQRRTYDSSATPKPGRVAAAPKAVAEVDLAALKQRLAESTHPPEKGNSKAATLPAIDEAEVRRAVEAATAEHRGRIAQLVATIEQARELLTNAIDFGSRSAPPAAVITGDARPGDAVYWNEDGTASAAARQRRAKASPPAADTHLGKCERTLLPSRRFHQQPLSFGHPC
ncbi:MAG TPA: hypothetical protein P5572_20240 [Phycisphaerae bacterium]|nr:hypothetical protein [Phycisphaerae bacterium]